MGCIPHDDHSHKPEKISRGPVDDSINTKAACWRDRGFFPLYCDTHRLRRDPSSSKMPSGSVLSLFWLTVLVSLTGSKVRRGGAIEEKESVVGGHGSSMFWAGVTRAIPQHVNNSACMITLSNPPLLPCRIDCHIHHTKSSILTMTRAGRRHAGDLTVLPSAQSRPMWEKTRHIDYIRMTFRSIGTDNGCSPSTLRFVATWPYVNTHRQKHPIELLQTLRYSQDLQGPESIEDPVGQCGQPILVESPFILSGGQNRPRTGDGREVCDRERHGR